MIAFEQARRFTVVFAGGGTGGHLMPGISVAQEMRRRAPHARLVFAGTSRPLERRLVEGHGFEFFDLPSLKLPESALATPSWMLRAAGGLSEGVKLLQRLAPAAVVSLGGYAAMGPAMSAALLGVPLAILEQNAIPGRVNRLLSWWAREIYVPWPGAGASFAHAERVHVTGNPVRCDLAVRRNRLLAARFGLSPRKRTLLVMGGSQGARFLNRSILAALDRFEAESSWLQVLHSAGEAHVDEVRSAYARRSVQAAVYPYIADMASAYALSDLVLSRAGGTTLAEITALGIPAVVVPLPSAANDHQRRNAGLIASRGGAILVEERTTTPDQLAGVLLRLLRDETLLARMRRASLQVGRPAAAGNVVNRLLGLIESSPAESPELALSETGS